MNNSILYLCFKKPNTKDEFELLADVAPGVNLEYDYSGVVKKREEVKKEDDWVKKKREAMQNSSKYHHSNIKTFSKY